MKNITQKAITLLVAACSMLSACKKDFLDTKPLDQVQATDTWKDAALAEAFVNGIYSGIGEGGFMGSSEEMLASFSDEAIFTHQGRGINTFNQGNLNPSNPGLVSTPTEWSFLYTQIRRANIALESLPTATLPTTTRERLEGEVRFLRAYFYHQLLRFYGGVPLITNVYGLGEDYTTARNTYADISSFIVKESDMAVTLLE
ncbi:MAG: RagB/SusD family nutrient uptake outer membrane protein, partial [Segetibacter sp.]